MAANLEFRARCTGPDSAASPDWLVATVSNGNVVTSLPEPFDWLFEEARFGLFRS